MGSLDVDAAPGQPARTRRWIRILMILCVFLGGGIVGAASGGLMVRNRMISMIRHPELVTDRIMPRVRSEIGLTPDQAAVVEEIVRHRHAAMESLRAETYPRQVAEFQAMRAEVAATLDPGQRERWFDLCSSVETRYLPSAPMGPPPADLLFRNFDANHDGILIEDEVPKGMWWRLKNADADGNGGVTADEYSEESTRRGLD